MIIDITLAIIFIASVVMVRHRIYLKIPELAAVPDTVITERLERDSARIRLFLLRLKAIYNEKRITETFYRILVKTLYRFHIVVLRFDNGLVSYLKRLHAKGAFSNGNGEYWKQLKTPAGSPTEQPHKVEEINPPTFIRDIKPR